MLHCYVGQYCAGSIGHRAEVCIRYASDRFRHGMSNVFMLSLRCGRVLSISSLRWQSLRGLNGDGLRDLHPPMCTSLLSESCIIPASSSSPSSSS
jgi:hypothetical protein